MIENSQINVFARNFVSGLSPQERLVHLDKSEMTLASLALTAGSFVGEKVSGAALGAAIKMYLDIATQTTESDAITLKGYSGL